MGLELVELVLSVEEAFDIQISDREAETITTPRQLVDYVDARFAERIPAPCLSQRAFYRVRRGLVALGLSPRSSLRPSAPLATVLPSASRQTAWAALGGSLRAPLPKLRRAPLIGALIPAAGLVAGVVAFLAYGSMAAIVAIVGGSTLVAWVTRPLRSEPPFGTVADLVQYLAQRHPQALLERLERPTRQQIEAIIYALIRDVTGLKSFDPDHHFVHDLAMD